MRQPTPDRFTCERTHALREFTVELRDSVRLRVASGRKRHREREQAIAFDADVHIAQIHETAQHQCTGGKEHERHGDLPDDQHAFKTPSAAPDPAGPDAGERRLEVAAGHGHGGDVACVACAWRS